MKLLVRSLSLSSIDAQHILFVVEAGFITQTIEIKAKGKISETELRMECSHEDCEWINSIKLNPKTKQWVVDNSSTLDSSSHNHLIEAIPSHHLAEAKNHLEELRAEKEKQLEELRDELETSSDVEKSAGARKTKKPNDSGVGLESEDSDRVSSTFTLFIFKF